MRPRGFTSYISGTFINVAPVLARLFTNISHNTDTQSPGFSPSGCAWRGAQICGSVPKRIPGCLGFSIRGEVEGGKSSPLPAWVGFQKGKKLSPKDTDLWPIQSFHWKDLYPPRQGRFRFQTYAVRGTPTAPVRNAASARCSPGAPTGPRRGLCGQTNNALLIEAEGPASHYHAYRKRLRNEQGEPRAVRAPAGGG